MAAGFALSSLLMIALVVFLAIGVVAKFVLSVSQGSQPVEIPHADRTPEEHELVQILTTVGKIHAIKSYRTTHKCGLKDAAQAIDCLQATGKLPVVEARSAEPVIAPTMSEEEEERIILPILESEGKIAAIKRYREITGSSLAHARARIEFIEERAPLIRASGNAAMPDQVPDELKG